VVQNTPVRKKIAVVKKWNLSGLSQAEFCRREGLKLWQLSEWKRFIGDLECVRVTTDVLGLQTGKGCLLGQSSKSDSCVEDHKRSHVKGFESQPFVPVTLIDGPTDRASDIGAAKSFDCALEIVLRRGQVVRVPSDCQMEFLNAVVSTLDCV
jgi:hypothetical protein